MFSIIISEKGGAERREAFDKNEINVGRVQGNDLMLPKGNVSKHHARLLFRDGRFIVTDLKSTNGTYVNGRKIAQATIVREGDKIYIGDFVLRLETNGQQAAPPPEVTAGAEDESIRTLARDAARMPPPGPAPPAVTLKAPTHPPAVPMPRPQPSNVSSAAPPGGPSRTEAPTAGYGMDPEIDDSAPAIPKPPRQASVAPPPPVGSGARPLTMPLNQMSPPIIGRGPTPAPVPQPGPAPMPAPGVASIGVSPSAPTPIGAHAPAASPAGPPPPAPSAPMPPPVAPPAPSAPPAMHQTAPPPPAAPPPPVASLSSQGPLSVPPARPTAPPPRVPPKETHAQAGRRLALMALIDRIGDALDLSPLRQSPLVPDAFAQQVDRVAREQAALMRDEGDVSPDVDLDGVVRDAHRELVGLGVLGPLLEDEEVTEINCVRFDHVFTMRGGIISAAPIAFSSEEALARVLARLAAQSGEPWKPGELVVERRLPRASMVGIAPPASANHVVSIRKRRRVESSFEELVRAGALSRPMAQFLEATVTARSNVLVVGPAALPVLAALAASIPSGERVTLVHDVDEVAVPQAHTVALAVPDTRRLGEECVRAAAKLRADRLLVGHLVGGVAAATMDAMAEGESGVLAVLPAPSLRQGLSRLSSQLVLYRPGLSIEAMREVVGEAFDVAVEVTASADGRLRVMRIAELGGADAKGVVARDVFVFTPDPNSGDGTHGPTGVVPRLAGDLAARGVKLDPQLFKRPTR